MQRPFVIRLQDDQTFWDARDIIKGLIFVATLQIRTPLSVLEHHGERHPGPPSAAPKYGSPADGYWQYETKTWAELAGPKAARPLPTLPLADFQQNFEQKLVEHGFSTPKTQEIASNYEAGQMASDIGPITPGEYLPFLKAFRGIVETSTNVLVKLKQLSDLCQRNPQFVSIWQRLEQHYDDFPASFFYVQLTTIPGIGSKISRRLFEAGFKDFDSIRSASDRALQRVPGIGSKLLKVIREAMTNNR